MIEPTKIRKILVFAYMGIGNLIIFLPTLLAFKKHFPEAKFSLVTNKNRSAAFKELLSGFDFHLIDEFIDFEGINASFGEKIEFIKRIRNSQFDMLIKNFLGGINLIIPFLRIPYRIGHISSPDFPISAGFVFNYPVRMDKDEHEIDRNLRLFYAVNNQEQARLIVERNLPPLTLPDILMTNAILSDTTTTLVAMQIGTSGIGDWKEWHPENFGKLAAELISKYGVKIALLGDKDAAVKGEKVVKTAGNKSSPHLINLIGKTKLLEAAVVIKRSKLLISNDAGLMWIAQVVGTPVITIFGPTDYRRTGPVAPNTKIIREDIKCSPCYVAPKDYKKVIKCRTRKCLTNITVQKVLEVLRHSCIMP